MSSKKWSGMLGIVVGSIWFAFNIKHFDEQGFVAIGMPIILIVAGLVFFLRGMKR